MTLAHSPTPCSHNMIHFKARINLSRKPAAVSLFPLPPFCCLQRSIDEKFRCVEEREGQVRRLQVALREKERDLERLRCILSNNEETITVSIA